MPDLLRRAAALTILSAVGIALLAPMAARSVAPVPADSIQPLLRAAPVSVMVPRGSLSDRQQAATRRAAEGTESVVGSAIPTPGSAPMEATLYIVPTPKPTPAPVARVPAAPAAPAGPVDMSNVWDRLAQCESGGNWAINTGNGYYGGLQFNYGTWLSYGGGQYAEYAHLASREQQIATAERLHAARGFQPWPACRRKLGLP